MTSRAAVPSRARVARVRAVALAAAVLLLAACRGGTPSPSTAPSVDPDAIADAFVATLTDPSLRATVVQQTTASASGGGDSIELRTTIGGELALPDVAVRVAIETEGELTQFAVVIAGDRSFVDLGEGWVEAPAGSVSTSELTNALLVVDDPADLAYEGTQEVDGVVLHHLAAVRPLPYATGGATGTIEGLDAYVEADGTPVQMTFAFTTSATDGAGTTTVVNGTTETRFADVGGDQAIAPPSLVPEASPSPAP
jgi:hypothetical protein